MREKITCVLCKYCNARMHSVFKECSMEQLDMLNDHKACSIYKKGQYIFTENSFPLGVFCINKGKVKLAASGLDGKEQILSLYKDGDILGYRALLSDERYQSSAIALEDSSICFISKSAFFNLMDDNHALGFKIIKLLSDNLKAAQQHILTLSQKNVRERMAEALLFIKATYGMQPDGKTLNVIMSREEIADFVGTSTESAIRLLSEFNHQGLIQLEGKRIKLLDIDKLTKTANLLD